MGLPTESPAAELSFEGFRRCLTLTLAGGVALLLAGCGRDQTTTYEVPRDAAPPAVVAGNSPHGGSPGAGGMPMGGVGALTPPTRPGLRWKTLPEGWTSQPASGMRAATFTIAGAAPGISSDVAVIPLPGTGGGDLDLVNLWRGLVNLAPIEAADLGAHTSETQIGGQPVKLFSIVAPNGAEAAAATNQIMVAALRKDDFTWFFRLTGPAAVVPTHLESLKKFLAGVEFTAPEAVVPSGPPPMAAAAAGRAGAGTGAGGGGQPPLEWTVPAGWRSVPAPQMVHSKWSLGAPGQGAADVSVSFFPGETGGLVANVNRWRSQVGLKPSSEAEITPLAENLEITGGKATLVDYAGSNPEDGSARRIVAAVAKRGDQSWFFKLLGDPKVVEAEREAFVKFVQNTKLPRGS